MARSKFSKMLEKINNNEEVINSKNVEENDININSNTDIEDDDDITEEEMEEYLEACGSEFLGDDWREDFEDNDNDEDDSKNEDVDDNENNKDNEDNVNSDESAEIGNKCNEANDIESSNYCKENISKNKSCNKLEDESEKTRR